MCQFFAARLAQVSRQGNARLVVVVNGWDGLTTDPYSFVLLFGGHNDRVLLRIFAEEPRKFYAVNVKQVCEIFECKTPFNMEDDSLDNQFADSTALFVRRFYQIGFIKREMSDLVAKLREQSQNRNTPTEMIRDLSKWKCTQCDEAYPTPYSLNRHMHHKHPANEEGLKCGYCDQVFKRKDYRDRHMREVCKKRSSALADITDEPPAKMQRAPRGSKLRVAPAKEHDQGSDGGIKPYRAIEDPGILEELPPLDIANLAGEIIYKGELYCRWPGCENRMKRYSAPTKLRTHYKQKHQFEYQSSTTGILNPADQQAHEKGLQWLIKYAQLGKENAGEKPIPTRK